MSTSFLASNPLPLAMTEVSQPCPTSRAFLVELADGDRVHVSFTTIPKDTRNSRTSLHRTSNRDINQTIIHLANQKPLKDY